MKTPRWLAPSPSRLSLVLLVAGLLATGSRAQAQSAAPDAQAQPDAGAQLSRIFVASNGKDSNNGLRLTPKRTLQAAHNALAPDGEIVIVDTAVYGPLNITKGLTVLASPGAHGIISVTGNADGIDIPTGSNIGVILRGLVIEGGGQTAGGSGIGGSSALYLVVEDCTIRNFFEGIYQSTAGSTTSITNTAFIGCSSGVYLNVAAGPDASANVNHCRFELNGSTGLFARNNNSGASLAVTVTDSIFYRNNTGIYAGRVGGNGASSTVLVSNSVITSNTYGVTGGGDSNHGLVLSRGNNTLVANANGNAFDGTFDPK